MRKFDSEVSIFKVSRVGNSYRLTNTNGEDVGTLDINTFTRRRAFDAGNALKQVIGKTGKISYRLVEMDEYSKLVTPLKEQAEVNSEPVVSHTEITDFIHNKSVELKPEFLVMTPLKWKYLIRSAVRAKNIMMTGPAGCGKTLAAKSLVKALNTIEYGSKYVTERELEEMRNDMRFSIVKVTEV